VTLDPVYTKRLVFLNEELLDPDDQLAQWIANVGRALNDLLIATRRLSEDFTDGSSQGMPEALYDARASAIHVWEFAKFLRLSETYSEDVRKFVNETLHKPALAEYREALAALQEPEPSQAQDPEERSFKEALVRARDQGTHYAKLDTKPLRQAMKLSAGTKDKPAYGSLFMGEGFEDFNAEFATRLDHQLFLPSPIEVESLRNFIDRLGTIVGSLVCFAGWALQSYFAVHRPPSTEVLGLSPRSVPFPVEDD
jgi:hypothetical protein